MKPKNFRSNILIVTVLSLTLFVFSSITFAVELEQDDTQTPSEKIDSGVIRVIERDLVDNEVQSESKLLAEAKTLIKDGVPPGTLVATVKSIKTGHLDPEDLENVFEDMKTEILEGGKPPGQLIKTIKTGSKSFKGKESEDEESSERENVAKNTVSSNKVRQTSKGNEGDRSSGKKIETSENNKEMSKDKGPQKNNEKFKEKDNQKGPPDKKQSSINKGRDQSEVKEKIKKSAGKSSPEDKGPPEHAGKKDKEK